MKYIKLCKTEIILNLLLIPFFHIPLIIAEMMGVVNFSVDSLVAFLSTYGITVITILLFHSIPNLLIDIILPKVDKRPIDIKRFFVAEAILFILIGFMYTTFLCGHMVY